MARFTKGTPKPAGSGRKKGTPNKLTLVKAEATMLAMNFNPTEHLINLIRSGTLPPMIEAKVALELLEFSQAKPKSLPEEPDDENYLPAPELSSVNTALLEASLDELSDNRADQSRTLEARTITIQAETGTEEA